MIINQQSCFSDEVSGAGGKGGGGGSAHTPVEASDTLSSKQTIRVLLAIGEGEIAGIDDVLLNGVSIASYPSVTMDWRPGTVDQTYIPGFSDIEAPISGAGGFPVTTLQGIAHNYSLSGAKSAARITFSLASLKQVMPNGDRVGYSVSHSIYTRNHPAGGSPGSWIIATETTKTGKASNAYSWDLRIERPAATGPNDTWEIQVIRDTANDVSLGDSYISPSGIQQIITIIDSVLTYPYTALLALTITDASVFSYQVPVVRILPRGMKFALPSNYDPVSRVYTGVWDGYFKSFNEYTNNLAWVIYYSLINSRWGLAIAQADIDLGSFYLFARYCDGLIPDGLGGTVPRYRIDIQFLERSGPANFLMQLLTLGNANLSSNDFGQVAIVYDHPSQATTKLVGNSNVIEGLFDYTSNALESRTNLVNVTFSDRNLLGDTNTATYHDDNLITRYGLQTSDIVLAGCTNEAQAIYKAKWALWANCIDTELITWKQLFAGALYHIGELVSIMDSDNVDSVAHHAVAASFTQASGQTHITLDRALTLTNEAFTLQCVTADGVTISQLLLNETNGSFTVVTVNSLITPFLGSTLLFSGATIKPRTGKVIKISQSGEEYTITCVNHNEAKYAYYESAAAIITPDASGSFINFNRFLVPPVTSITVAEVFASDGVVNHTHLAVAWQWDTAFAEKFKALFRISYTRDNQDYKTADNLTVSGFDIPDPLPGSYQIYIWAINPFSGLLSTTVSYVYNYRIAAALSSLNPPINLEVAGTTGGLYTSKDLALYWENPASNLTTSDKLRDFILEFLDDTTLVVVKTYIVLPDQNQHGNFVLTFVENVAIFGVATRKFRVRVYCRDLMGDKSNYAALVCDNATPSVQSFDIMSGVSSTFINVTTANSDPDIVGYKIWRKAASTWSLITDAGVAEIYDGPDTYITLNVPDAQLYYYKIAAYDSFGKTGLTLSGATSNRALSVNAVTWVLQDVIFKPNDPANNSISWTAGSIVRTDGSLVDVFTIASGSAAWTTGKLYIYFSGSGAISTTPTLAIAVGVGGYIIGVYNGGKDFSFSEGKAFIDGSTLLAATVGTNQLVAGSVTAAILDTGVLITDHAQIGAAVIDNAAIKDFIKSTNFSPGTGGVYAGWKLDKYGNFCSYGNLELYDSNGNAILTTGTSAALQWAKVAGTGKPADGATLGATFGSNIFGKINATNVTTYIDSGAIKTAQIGVAEIVAAHIGTGEIDTLRIKGAAVTVPVTVQSGQAFGGIGLTRISFCKMHLDSAGVIYAHAISSQGYGHGIKSWYMQLRLVDVNGGIVAISDAGGLSVADTISLAVSNLVGAGWFSIELWYQGQDGNVHIDHSTIFAMGAKR